MDPILTVLEIGTIERPIGTYGVCVAMGLLVGAFMAVRSAHRAGIDVGGSIAAIGFAVAGGLLGAMSMFWLVEFVRTGSPTAGIEQPGLVFYGGPMGGLLGLWFGARKLELPLGRFIDVAIAALPAGHALGRLGCFFGGCCYGRPWEGPWAVRYLNSIAPASWPPVLRHPTPLYEAFLLLCFSAVLLFWKPRRVGTGRRAGVYLIGYACIRLITELFRGDSVRGIYFGVVSTSQLISIALLVVGAALVAGLDRRGRLEVAAP